MRMVRFHLPRILGLAVLSLLLAVPSTPAEPSSPQQAQAEAVLARTHDLGRRLKTFSADVTLTKETFDAKGQLTARSSSHMEVLLRRPAHWRVVTSSNGKTSTFLCDGKDRYSFLHNSTIHRYKLTARDTPPMLGGCLVPPLLDPDQPLVAVRDVQLYYLGKLEHDRRSCDVIQVRGECNVEFQHLLFLDSSGVFVKVMKTYFDKDGITHTFTHEITRYALDPELPPEQFAFKLPEGTKLIDVDAEQEKLLAKVKQRDDPLLKVGEKVPAFEVPDTDGNLLTLGELLKGKKALVLHLTCFG